MVSRRVVELGVHSQDGLIGSDLQRGLDHHGVGSRPRLGRSVHPIGPGEGGGDDGGGPDRPGFTDGHRHGVGSIDDGVDGRRGVVVGVSEVTVVHQLSVARDVVDRECSVGQGRWPR